MNRHCLKIICILICGMPLVVSGGDRKTTQQQYNKHIQNIGILGSAAPDIIDCDGPYPPHHCR